MPRCNATTRKGLPCKANCKRGFTTCNMHIMLTPLAVEQTCSICYETIQKHATLECNHNFCKGCISEWFAKCKNTCPCCRAVVQDAKIIEITGKPLPAPAARRAPLPPPNRVSAPVAALLQRAVDTPLDQTSARSMRAFADLYGIMERLAGHFD